MTGSENPIGSAVSLDELRSGFAEPPLSAAPRMRWWWFGPSVTEKELDRELTAMAAAGLGGAEVAYVYPLAEATTTLGSDTFLADLRFAAERARELGLALRPHPRQWLVLRRPAHLGRAGGAAAALGATGDRARARWKLPVVSPWPGDDLVAAYIGPGSLQEQPAEYERLPVADGRLIIEASTGPRVVLLAYAPADRAERQARGSRRGGSGARPLLRRRHRRRTCERSAIRCSTPFRPSSSGRSSATASRCTAPTGPRTCRRSSPGDEATTSFRCSTC